MRKYFFHTVYALTGIILFCADAHGANIVLITRDDIAPYRAFTESYCAAVKKYGHPDHRVKVFTFSRNVDDTQKLAETVRRSTAAVLVCVGVNAVDFCQNNFPETPRIACMIPSYRDLTRFAHTGALGIPMEADPVLKFATLRTILPTVKTFGAVYDPAEVGELIRAAANAARMQGFDVRTMQVNDPKDAPAAVEKIMEQVDAFLLFYDRTVLTPQTLELILNASFFGKKPVVGFSEKYASLGALVSCEVSIADIARTVWSASEHCLAASGNCRGIYTTKSPGQLIINKKIADKFGLTIPETILEKSSIIE